MLRCLSITVALLLLTEAAQPQSVSCPTTLQPSPAYKPLAPYPHAQSANAFWYGSDELWTALPENGMWHTEDNINKHGSYATKLVFWHRGFDWRKEREPNFSFTGTRLDAEASMITIHGAIPVFISRAPAMMIGVDVPTIGCWQFTARYQGRALSFTVLVEP